MNNKALIMDDSPGLADALSEWFKAKGYEADGVMTVAEAERRIMGESYDIVVLDLVMGDGETAVDLIAKHDMNGSRIVLMTGYPDHKLIDVAISMSDYVLFKPLHYKALSHIIDEVKLCKESSD